MNLDSSKPLYLQIEADIKNNILSKKYKPGEKLPTENVLSEQYEVSKITIRKAIQKLSDEGFVKKVQGKGTFVTYQKDKLLLNKTSGFKEVLSTKGHSAKNEVIQASFLNADENISDKLSIPMDTKTVYLERLVWEDNEPMALDKIYFENDKFPDFITKLDDNRSFYQILEESYAIKPKNSVLEINGISANSHQADILKCNIGDPLFYINKISYDENNKPIHYSITTIRCDRITYVVFNNDTTTTNEKIKS
ncbi:GntR family transcriptional regulator [Allobaculum stercoricanis]|uniref:GntR family transcriptional regulator n=1 Tax=Allobaculum stercoricanis TaxID=174709 RepID=UPI000374C4E2|nr:GntR family transcriptional regulator [Allobaculum stercoricanis]